MFRLRWIVVSAALLATSLLAVPATIGWQLADALQQGVIPLGPVAKITVTHFQRGWLRSQARLWLQLDHGLLPPLDLHTRFEQGPWSLGDDYWPVLLRAVSRIDPASLWCRQLLASCDLLRIDSTLDWHGASQNRISTTHLTLRPPLTPVPMSWQQLSAQLSLPPAHQPGPTRLRVTATRLTLPELSLRQPSLALQITPRGRLADSVLELGFAGATANAQHWGPLTLKVSASRVDPQQLQQILLQPTVYNATALMSGQQLLARRPQLNLRVRWQSPSGPLRAKIRVRLKPVNLLALALGRNSLLAIVDRAKGELSAPRALTERLLAWWSTHQRPTIQARAGALRLLQHWQKTGFVSLQNNVYHCRFAIEDDRLVVNGATMLSRR